MNKNEVDRLEEISAYYEKGDYMDELLVDREIEIIQRYCSTSKAVLEVGCGNGYSTKILSQFFDDIEVVEPSSKNMALMKSKVSYEVLCHNVLLENFSTSKKFDYILFLNVLEHVEDPVGSLEILAGLIKDEGLIFISAPNCMSLNRRAGYKMGLLDSYDKLAPKDFTLGHRRLYTVEMMVDHCLQAGLRVVETKGIYLKPLSEKQMIDLGDNAVRAFYSLGEDIPQYCANILTIATGKYY
jgi:2-polyprenyl-3-methyl-5-hydroxy-6-metoxy-1,4-benzoquinol methylase